jgi:uncharacterized RDD family membrane protein YckC
MAPHEPPYAGFWVRLLARVIDFLVILGVYNLFYMVDKLGGSAGLWSPASIDSVFDIAGGLSPDNVVRGIFFLFFPPFYYVYLHGAYGQTFGKMAFRIKVVNEDGTPLSYRRAFLRWLGYFLCDLTLNIGYLWVAFDARKQGFHDKICRTIVVHADAARAEVPKPPADPSAPPGGA